MKITKAKSMAVAVSKQANVMPGDGEAAARLVEQYNIVMKLETSCFRERVKFGLALIEWENYLGEGRGRGRDGEGLRGWLETHCPEIAYATAMEYKTYARQAVALNGGGMRVVAALLGEATVRQPDGEVVEIEAETIEKCEKFFADVDSRRKLQQAYFDFMNGDVAQKGGKKKRQPRKVVAVAEGEGLSMSDSATVMWADAMRTFEENRAAFHSAARDLKPMVARKFLSELKMLVDALEKRIDEED